MSFKYELLKKLVVAAGLKKRWLSVMGFPVLKLIHKEHANRANLFLIGGGMISVPRPASVKKALRFAKETGLDLSPRVRSLLMICVP